MQLQSEADSTQTQPAASSTTTATRPRDADTRPNSTRLPNSSVATPAPSATTSASTRLARLPSSVATSVRQCIRDASAPNLVSDAIAAHDATRVREAAKGCSIAENEVAGAGLAPERLVQLIHHLDFRAIQLGLIEDGVVLGIQHLSYYDDYEVSAATWADETTALLNALT